MKPAHEPASSRPKPCASLKNAPRILPVRRSLLAIVGRKQTVVRGQLFPQKPSRFAPLILAHRGSALPWLVDDRAAFRPRLILVRTHPIERHQALRDSAPCLSRATHIFLPPYTIGSVTTLSGHAIACRWRPLPRVRCVKTLSLLSVLLLDILWTRFFGTKKIGKRDISKKKSKKKGRNTGGCLGARISNNEERRTIERGAAVSLEAKIR